VSLLYFALSAYGLTQILVYGKIFEKIRPSTGWIGELLSCPMCTGFWVGILLWVLNGETTLFSFDYSLVTGVLLGCVSSGTSYVLNMLFGDDGIRVSHKGLAVSMTRNRSNVVRVRR